MGEYLNRLDEHTPLTQNQLQKIRHFGSLGLIDLFQLAAQNLSKKSPDVQLVLKFPSTLPSHAELILLWNRRHSQSGNDAFDEILCKLEETQDGLLSVSFLRNRYAVEMAETELKGFRVYMGDVGKPYKVDSTSPGFKILCQKAIVAALQNDTNRNVYHQEPLGFKIVQDEFPFIQTTLSA